MSVPVYVILGHQDEHLGLLIAMEEMKLFDKGEVTLPVATAQVITLPNTRHRISLVFIDSKVLLFVNKQTA
jgi:hypothetical protein